MKLKKELLSIMIMMLTLTIPTSVAKADMFNDPSLSTGMSNMTDFSMDMIINQGTMSMDNGYEAISDANETNFMNHQMDDTMNFFFDSMSGQNDDLLPINIDNNNNEINNAFEDGLWSASFNDHFNNNNVMVLPEINFVDSGDNSSSGSLDMPSLADSDILEPETPLDQVDINTMPDDISSTNSPETNLMDNNDLLSSNDILEPDTPLDNSLDLDSNNNLNLDTDANSNSNLPEHNDPNENNGLNHDLPDNLLDNGNNNLDTSNDTGSSLFDFIGNLFN